jgi:hypothetical protein
MGQFSHIAFSDYWRKPELNLGLRLPRSPRSSGPETARADHVAPRSVNRSDQPSPFGRRTACRLQPIKTDVYNRDSIEDSISNRTEEMPSASTTGCFSGIFRWKASEPATRAFDAGQAAVFVDEEVRRASLSLHRPELPEKRNSSSPERSRRSEEYGGDLHLLSA